jgi:hypothetical protein
MVLELKNGPRSLNAPVDNLYSNWAYMLISSLAWTLKAWLALSLPETGRWKEQRRKEKFRLLKMEFRTFVTAIIRIPCQIVRTGRRRIFRLLNGNAMQPTFWRQKFHSRSGKVTLCRMDRLLLQSRRRRSPSN